jgi:hypothetical protein
MADRNEWKTVLFITTEPRHRILYEKGLRAGFELEFQPAGAGRHGRVDAVVYDLPERLSGVDLQWLEELSVPVVVLTSLDEFPLPPSPRRRILTYPVNVAGILRALAELGIEPFPADAGGDPKGKEG